MFNKIFWLLLLPFHVYYDWLVGWHIYVACTLTYLYIVVKLIWVALVVFLEALLLTVSKKSILA